jgi:hypothetical protein
VKEPLYWENLLIFVAQKKQEGQSADIAIFGIVCMATIG